MLEYAFVVAIGFHLFVILYEEPTLRQTFGCYYQDYCRSVVSTKNSERAGKSRVLVWAAVVSPACLSSSDRSFLGLYADSVVGRLWN